MLNLEKAYINVKTIISRQDEYEMNRINEYCRIGSVPKHESNETVINLTELFMAIDAELKAKIAKENGTTNQIKVIKRMMKAKISRTDILNRAFHNPEGKEMYCNSYELYIPEKNLNVYEYKEDETSKYFNQSFWNIFNNTEQQNDKELKLPELSELKRMLVDGKANAKANNLKPKKYDYDFGENYPAFDVDVLINAIEFCGDELTARYSREKSAVIIHGTEGKALIMPVHKQTDTNFGGAYWLNKN